MVAPLLAMKLAAVAVAKKATVYMIGRVSLNSCREGAGSRKKLGKGFPKSMQYRMYVPVSHVHQYCYQQL